MPVLGKVGCNAGTCHGCQGGKNGFKLSLRGYDPDYDYNALVNDLHGRRFEPRRSRSKSLMLLKPTGAVPHEGGVVFQPGDRGTTTSSSSGSRKASTIEPTTSAPRRRTIEVLPAARSTSTCPAARSGVIVLAHYPDGTTRDVTREAVTQLQQRSKSPKVDGQHRSPAIRRGEAAVLVRYEGNYAAASVSVMGDRTGFAWAAMPEYNFIDKHVNAKLAAAEDPAVATSAPTPSSSAASTST